MGAQLFNALEKPAAVTVWLVFPGCSEAVMLLFPGDC